MFYVRKIIIVLVMQKINFSKKNIYIFFLFFVFFSINNLLDTNLNSGDNYFENCLKTFSKELFQDQKSGFNGPIDVNYEQIPIYPEVQNIKCINKIIGKSIDSENSNIKYYVGYSKIFFLLQGSLFIIFLFLFKKLILNIGFYQLLIYFNIFLFLQFYGLPIYIIATQIIKLNIILLTLKIFILNTKVFYSDVIFNTEVKNENGFALGVLFLNITLFVFSEHMKNFYYKNYMINFSSWTINYTGGLNRRGLIGELLTFNNLLIDLKVLVALTIALVYGFIMYSVWIIYRTYNQNYISTLVIISPLYLLFVINDFRGGNFKEILGMLSFALLVLYNAKRQRVLIYLSILIYIVAIFSHTVNLFIFPLIIFYIHKFSLFYKKNIIYTSITLSVLAYIGLIFSPIFSEKFFDSKIWCTNLISNFNLNNSCNDLLAGNMIEFKLNASYLDTVQYTFSNLTSYTFINYLVLFLIANLYLFKTNFFLENKKELSLIYFLFLPLFVTALDWGRWLYILFFCLYTIFISLPNKELKIVNNKLSYFLLFIPTFVIYVPHCCANNSIRNILAFNLDTFHLFDFLYKLYNF